MRKALFLAVCLVACGSSESGGVVASDRTVEPTSDAAPLVCEPGKQIACACVGGAIGAQRCSFDGNDWGVCKCPEVDSGAVAPEQDAAVDSGAPEPADIGTQPIDDSPPMVEPCGSWRFVVLDAGSAGCPNDGSGTVLDAEKKTIYTRHSWSNGVSYTQAKNHCESIGARLPTLQELDNIKDGQPGRCAFDCEWQSWAYVYGAQKTYFTSSSAQVGASLIANTAYLNGVICVKSFTQ